MTQPTRREILRNGLFGALATAVGIKSSACTISTSGIQLGDQSWNSILDEEESDVCPRFTGDNLLPHDYQILSVEEIMDHASLTESQYPCITTTVIELEHRFAQNGAIRSARLTSQRDRALEVFENVLSRYSELASTHAISEMRTYVDEMERRDPENFRLVGSRELLDTLIETNFNELHDIITDYLGDNTIRGGIRHFHDAVEARDYDCDTYSLIVLGIAERLDLPISAVGSPGHMFTVWYGNGIQKVFDQGETLPNYTEYELGDYNPDAEEIPAREIADGTYLRRMHPAEAMGHFVAAISLSLYDNCEFAAADDLSRGAHNLAPNYRLASYVRSVAANDIEHTR